MCETNGAVIIGTVRHKSLPIQHHFCRKVCGLAVKTCHDLRHTHAEAYTHQDYLERKAYKQVDGEGLLGEIRDNTRKGIVQNHLTHALEEMDAVLELLDKAVAARMEAV